MLGRVLICPLVRNGSFTSHESAARNDLISSLRSARGHTALEWQKTIDQLAACVGLFPADRHIYDSMRNIFLERKGQPKIAWDAQCTVQIGYEAGQTENPTPIEK